MEARLLEMAKIDRPFARAFALRWGFFWTSLRLSLRAIFVAARFGRGLAVEVGIRRSVGAGRLMEEQITRLDAQTRHYHEARQSIARQVGQLKKLANWWASRWQIRLAK